MAFLDYARFDGAFQTACQSGEPCLEQAPQILAPPKKISPFTDLSAWFADEKYVANLLAPPWPHVPYWPQLPLDLPHSTPKLYVDNGGQMMVPVGDVKAVHKQSAMIDVTCHEDAFQKLIPSGYQTMELLIDWDTDSIVSDLEIKIQATGMEIVYPNGDIVKLAGGWQWHLTYGGLSGMKKVQSYAPDSFTLAEQPPTVVKPILVELRDQLAGLTVDALRTALQRNHTHTWITQPGQAQYFCGVCGGTVTWQELYSVGGTMDEVFAAKQMQKK